MPDPTVEPAAHPRPVRLWAVLDDLDDAHATVTTNRVPGGLVARIGSADAHASLYGDAPTLRRLFTDALAQIDAIEAGR